MKPKQEGVERLNCLRGLPVKWVLLRKEGFPQIWVKIKKFHLDEEISSVKVYYTSVLTMKIVKILPAAPKGRKPFPL